MSEVKGIMCPRCEKDGRRIKMYVSRTTARQGKVTRERKCKTCGYVKVTVEK